MEDRSKFIYTNDAQMKENLIKSGYPLFKECDGRYWVFINTDKGQIKFTKNNKLIFTDRIIF